jgi:shikimate kinase
MKIILIGPRSVGKSTIGKRLAAKLKLKYFDFDMVVEHELGDIDNYIKNNEVDSYRKKERKILVESLSKLTCEFVMSVGGGTVASQLHHISELNSRDLKNLGKIIYLSPSEDEDRSIELLRKRELKRKGNQSFEHTKKLYGLRRKIYEKIYDYKIILEEKSPGEVVKEVIDFISAE